METKNEQVKELVERVGIWFEKSGHQPLVGRIMGYLFCAEPPHKSFDEIVVFLKASKSAVSNALNLMIRMDVVEYITFIGDRKRYFRMNIHGLENTFLNEMRDSRNFRILLNGVHTMRSDKYPEFNKALSNFMMLFDVIEEEMPIIIEKWRKKTQQE